MEKIYSLDLRCKPGRARLCDRFSFSVAFNIDKRGCTRPVIAEVIAEIFIPIWCNATMWFFRWTTVLQSAHAILATSRLSRNTAPLPSMALSDRVDLLGLDLAGNNVWLGLSMLTFLTCIGIDSVDKQDSTWRHILSSTTDGLVRVSARLFSRCCLRPAAQVRPTI